MASSARYLSRPAARPMAAAPQDGAAFVPGPRSVREPTGRGVLNGRTFAAKDLIDVAGDRKTSGNPDWQRTHPAALRSAPVVDRLLAAGARLVGKTITDELAFSLEGENLHYGTPRNPRAPDRLPGGSSSGSASAVAAGEADFALGTDTGGSVRVPACFCGLFGIRPTRGRVPLEGVTPLAPSFDTLGWMSRSGRLLAEVGAALWGSPVPEPRRLRAKFVADAVEIAEPRIRELLRSEGPRRFEIVGEVRLYDGSPDRVVDAYRAIQGREAWALHGPWIVENRPRFAEAVQGRFEAARRFTAADEGAARRTQTELIRRVDAALEGADVLLLPGAPTVPPPRDARARAERPKFRATTLAVEGIGSLTGCPEIVIPVAPLDELPAGLGAIGARGADERLLAEAARDPSGA